eukprot:TRINITY_DN104_c0_g1_i1.p1 TRINITY_DN104_c0_g1~~TRINITY_DN104_c0_g1_i1.p1  ORF type:complete len:500 (+),score=89.18 TRINITY_DN104_c0_g1_i1:38-1501(+)
MIALALLALATPLAVSAQGVACAMNMRPALGRRACAAGAAIENAGCVSLDAMCAQVVTYAVDSNNVEWVFADACLPAGFSAVASLDCAAYPSVCAASEVAVMATPMCVARQEAGINSAATVFAGCVSSSVMCTQVESFATRDGAVFRFESCVPAGFEPLAEAPREVVAHHKAAFCENAASTVVAGCVAASQMCAQVVTFAADASGEVFVFDDSCVPSTFTVLPEESCTAAPRCNADQQEVFGIPVDWFCDGGVSDADRDAHSVFSGCVGNNIRCVMEPTFARNTATGETRVFRMACLPEGWERAEASCEVYYCSVVDCPAATTCAVRPVQCLMAPCPGVPTCISTECVGHMNGEPFLAADGCNTCSCTADGAPACTKLMCATNPCESVADGTAVEVEDQDPCAECSCVGGEAVCVVDKACEIDAAGDSSPSKGQQAGIAVGVVGLSVVLVAGAIMFAKYMKRPTHAAHPDAASRTSRRSSAPYARFA